MAWWPKSRPRNTSEVCWPNCCGPSTSLMPYWVTMARAISEAFSMSLAAPVVGSSKMSSSAVRPPMSTAIWSRSSERLTMYLSSVGSDRVQPRARPRATIDTLCTGSAWGSTWPTRAWPPSW